MDALFNPESFAGSSADGATSETEWAADFFEHGRSSDPGVVVWQDRITPLWKRIGGGCHLNRSPQATRSSSASDVEKKSVGVRAGRQDLAFGDERLLGNANWLNTARSFDALRGQFATVDFAPTSLPLV